MQFCHHFPLILITGMRIACDSHCYALHGSEKQAALRVFRNQYLPQKGWGQHLNLDCFFFKHYFRQWCFGNQGKGGASQFTIKINLVSGWVVLPHFGSQSFGVGDQVASWEGEEMHTGVWGLQVETSKKAITPPVPMVLEMYVSGS